VLQSLSLCNLPSDNCIICFAAHYVGEPRAVKRAEEKGRPQRRAGLDVVESKQLMVLFYILHSNKLILSASVPCSAGGPRAVRRAEQNGAPSTPGRLGENDRKVGFQSLFSWNLPSDCAGRGNLKPSSESLPGFLVRCNATSQAHFSAAPPISIPVGFSGSLQPCLHAGKGSDRPAISIPVGFSGSLQR
jgi:hypothetical protein